jgi:hypothetical protein
MRALESVPVLRAGELARAGWLHPGEVNNIAVSGLIGCIHADEDMVTLTVLTSRQDVVEIRAALVWQPMPCGGMRAMFGCPRCGERRNALYWKADLLACRRCHRLPTLSDIYTSRFRFDELVEGVLARVRADLAPSTFTRPKGVKSATWSRVVDEVHTRLAGPY